jgi:FdhE protein
VCRMLQPYQAGAEAAAAALDAGHLDLVTLLENLLISPSGEPVSATEAGDTDPLILRVLLEYTLRPTLRAWSRQLAQGVALENWQRGTCPICGTLPLLAELHKSTRQRLLRCAFCGAAWPYPIRKCVHCANEDPQTQALIANHDDERLFVQTCKRCKVYLKSVFTEEPLPHDLLSLEDLASLYLDQGCQKSGYLRLTAETD